MLHIDRLKFGIASLGASPKNLCFYIVELRCSKISTAIGQGIVGSDIQLLDG